MCVDGDIMKPNVEDLLIRVGNTGITLGVFDVGNAKQTERAAGVAFVSYKMGPKTQVMFHIVEGYRQEVHVRARIGASTLHDLIVEALAKNLPHYFEQEVYMESVDLFEHYGNAPIHFVRQDDGHYKVAA
jgi:hypothetical protein